MKKFVDKISHPKQAYKSYKEKRKNQQGEQQQGESSMQPPPGLASSFQQATTSARPPTQSSSASPLTLDRLLSGLKAQNGSKDSLIADAQNREKSDTYAPRFMLHGTSKSNADSIEETGLQTSYGGQEGGASRKMKDPTKYIENSQGVVHGTPSKKTVRTYGGLHSKPSAGGSGGDMSPEDNSGYIGFEAEDPKSINRDNNSDAGYKVSQSLPPNKVVRVPNEIVEEAFDPTNPFPS